MACDVNHEAALRFSLTRRSGRFSLYRRGIRLFASEILSLIKDIVKVLAFSVLAFSYFSKQVDRGGRIVKIRKESVGRILLQLVHGVLA